jgi:UDP-2-acetamido-2-deoxy-ribo-hexuluronate aminotransferase
MREIRVHGQERRYYHTRIGVGGRMDTLQCAIVLAKLDTFADEIAARKRIGERYLTKLAGNNRVGLPVVRPDRDCVWAQFTVQVENRDRVALALKDRAIPTAVHYPVPLHWQPAYKDICRVVGSLENAERVAGRVLSLPMHPYLDEATQDRIVASLLDVAV